MSRTGGAALVLLLGACTPDVAPIAQAEITTSAADTPAGLAGAEWEPVTLPHRWSEDRPDFEGTVWYRVRVDPEAHDRYGVLLPRLRMNAAVFVNGAWIGDGGRFDPPVAQNWNRPLYFELPRELLEGDGYDVVHVRLFSYGADRGGLGRMYVGPHDALVEAYEWQRTLEVDVSRIVFFAILVVMLLLSGLMASPHRDEFAWLLVAAGCLALHSLAGQVGELPVPYRLTRWALHSSIDAFALGLLGFVNRWAGHPAPRLERALWIVFGLGILITALVPHDVFLPVALVVHVYAIAVGFGATGAVARQLLVGPRLEPAVGLAFGVVAMSLGVAGVFPYIGVLPPESPRLIVLMGPAMLLGFCVLVAIRYARAAKQAAATRADLARQVKEREAELRAELRRTEKLERMRAIDAERERLMREMHDGLGGQIVSLLHVAQRGPLDRDELVESLELTLDDMRMVIDSLDPDVDGLPTLLGMMRMRLGRRIEAAGVTLDWRVTDLPDLPWLGRAELSHVQRIVQESITNALKHARAETITVETGVDEDGVFVRVADDGVGLPDDPSLGRGLRNIEHRAAEIGATARVRRMAGGGTGVRLVLPFEAG